VRQSLQTFVAAESNSTWKSIAGRFEALPARSKEAKMTLQVHRVLGILRACGLEPLLDQAQTDKDKLQECS
jgi:hypothetical protein